MNAARGTPVPQTTYETIRVDFASPGSYGDSELATTPPEAAATTEATMGSSQTADSVSQVCDWRVKLERSTFQVEQTGPIGSHHEDHAKIDQNRHQYVYPP